MNTATIKLWLPGRVVPKARARVTANGSYHPKRYQDWRQLAQGQIICDMASYYQQVRLPQPSPVEVIITIQGKGHRGDLDNIAGAILDALVTAGVLVDDRLTCIRRLVIEYQEVGEVGALVELLPIELKC